MSNEKNLMVGGKRSRNLATFLAFILSLGVSGNALACSEGALACGNDCAADDGESSCNWEISSDGKLTITGSGYMKSYNTNRTIAENTTVSGKSTTLATYGDYWDKITSITIDEGIKSAGDRSFQGLSQVTSVTIPKSMETIGYATFDRMPQMSSFTVPEDSKLKSLDSASFQYSSSLNNSDAQTIINTLAANNDELYTLPWNSFSHGNISEITIPSGIDFGSSAMSHNKLKTLIIPEGVETIGYNAFSSNDLETLVLPNGITTLATYAFQNNNLTEVKLPDDLTEIPAGLFQNNKLTSIEIPNTVTSIGDNALKINQLSGDLIIPDSVTYIGTSAFQDNNLTSVYIPESVTTLRASAFGLNPNLKDIIFSDNVDASKWMANALSGLPENLTIHCQGDIDKCTTALARFIPEAKGGTCKSAALCFKGDYKIVEAKDAYCTGKCNGTSCQLTKYYFNGSTCIKEPDASKRTCDYENTGYIKVGNYCGSPETTYAKKHYTPAEANYWLKDDDNIITLIFKK